MNYRTIIAAFWLFILLLIVWLIVVMGQAEAKDINYGVVRVSRVKSVYDGDTFKVDIDQWPAVIGLDMAIRLLGIDTPELRGSDPNEKALGYEAKAFLIELLDANDIILMNVQRGKYFRIVADVIADGKNISKEMIKAGFAYEYYGGTRRDWNRIID